MSIIIALFVEQDNQIHTLLNYQRDEWGFINGRKHMRDIKANIRKVFLQCVDCEMPHIQLFKIEYDNKYLFYGIITEKLKLNSKSKWFNIEDLPKNRYNDILKKIKKDLPTIQCFYSGEERDISNNIKNELTKYFDETVYIPHKIKTHTSTRSYSNPKPILKYVENISYPVIQQPIGILYYDTSNSISQPRYFDPRLLYGKIKPSLDFD